MGELSRRSNPSYDQIHGDSICALIMFSSCISKLCRIGKQAQTALENKGVTVIADKDIYLCPADKELTHRLTGVENGITIKRYFLDVMTCRDCDLKPQCSNSKEPRRIARREYQDRMDRMEDKMASMPTLC